MFSSTRFTNTDKWISDNWFKLLPKNAKCLWWFLCENCKASGFIQLCVKDMYLHFELSKNETIEALFYLRKKVEFPSESNWRELKKDEFINDVLEKIEEPEYNLNIWIINYLKNQKNIPLSLNANVHKSIIKQLEDISEMFNEDSKIWNIKIIKKENNEQKTTTSFKSYLDKKTTTTVDTMGDDMGNVIPMVNSNSNSNSNSSSYINNHSSLVSSDSDNTSNTEIANNEPEVQNETNNTSEIIEKIANEKNMENKDEKKRIVEKLKDIGVCKNTIENICKDFKSIEEEQIRDIINHVKNNKEKYKNIDNFIYSAIKNNYKLKKESTEEISERLKNFRIKIGITKTRVQMAGYCSTKAYKMFPERYKVLFNEETHKNHDNAKYLPGQQVHKLIRKFPTFNLNQPDNTIVESEINGDFN